MLKKLFQKTSENESNSMKKSDEALEIRMPKLFDSMQNGTVSKWHVKVGDFVKAGDLLAELETDKATLELESYVDGTILALPVHEGEKVDVDEIIVVIGNEGEEIGSIISNSEPENYKQESLNGVIGEVKMFAGDLIPENWLKCDGSKYSKEEKEGLFSVIGNKYGESENTFQVPNIDSINGVTFIICSKTR